MENPLEFMRRFWNPAAVLDALDIKAWPPSVDEVDETFHYYGGHQHRAAREESARPRGDAPSAAPQGRPAAATTSFSSQQQPQQHQPAREDSARPRGVHPSSALQTRPATATASFSRQQKEPPPPRPGPPSPTRPWLSPRDAALRIQSAYRGHRVRNYVRRVADLEAEVEAVETRIMASLDQILRDDRERARVNEMIMDVLLKLDAVTDVLLKLDGTTDEDPRGWREYRRRVSKKAISLQEALDCLVGDDGRGGSGSGGDAADRPTHPKQLGREDSNRVIEEEREGGERADGDDREHGNISHEEEEEEEEEERNGGCGGVKEALNRMVEENTMLRGLVRELLERNDQQSHLVQQLSERVDYLERKLQRLGRKRGRSEHGSSGGSSSSSSAGEGESDHGKGCRDGQTMSESRDGGCAQQDDGRQR